MRTHHGRSHDGSSAPIASTKAENDSNRECRTGATPNAQGKLMFDFVSKVNYAVLNAIEILDESN